VRDIKKRSVRTDYKNVNIWECSSQCVATILGVSKGRITQMVDEGMPRNEDGTFDLCQAIQWRAGRYNQPSNARDRKTEKEIEKLEAQIDKMRGEVIPRSEHMQIMTSRAQSLNRFLERTTQMNVWHFVGKNMDELRVLFDQYVRDAMESYTGEREAK